MIGTMLQCCLLTCNDSIGRRTEAHRTLRLVVPEDRTSTLTIRHNDRPPVLLVTGSSPSHIPPIKVDHVRHEVTILATDRGEDELVELLRTHDLDSLGCPAVLA